MSEVMALAGRFYSDQLIAALDELATAGPVERYGGWGVAWCYGTLLEVARAGRRQPGEKVPGPDAVPRSPAGAGSTGRSRPDVAAAEAAVAPTEASPARDNYCTQASYDRLRDIKTDLAIIRLTDRAEMPAYSRDLQPFLRQETPRPQSFCAPGRLQSPEVLDIGRRITDSSDPAERFLLHILTSYDEADPLGSLTAMHERLADEPDQRFMLLNTKTLLVSTWREPTGDDPALWLGRGGLLRVLAPIRLESLGEMDWEPVPARTVMVFNRRRYEAG